MRTVHKGRPSPSNPKAADVTTRRSAARRGGGTITSGRGASTGTGITRNQIADGYTELVERYVAEGWAPYLMTFMFRQLGGSPAAAARQMEREVERIYARFVTRSVRSPRSPSNQGRLPIWLCCADYPVFKHEKGSLSDAAVNDGRHVHAVALQPPWSRLKTGLAEHFATEGGGTLYVRLDHPTARVHVRAITHDLDEAVGYALKAVRSGRVGEGEVFALPRSVSEMPS